MVSIHVAQLLKQATGATRKFEFDESVSTLGTDVTLLAPVRGHGRLMRTAQGILATADYEARVRADCSRCLTEVGVDVRGRVEEEFVPSLDIRTGEWIPETYEDAGVRIDESNVLDMDEVIRQDLLLNFPLRPLCEAACKGLCEVCGANLNVGMRVHAHADDDDESAADDGAALGRLGEALRRAERRATSDEGVEHDGRATQEENQ